MKVSITKIENAELFVICESEEQTEIALQVLHENQDASIDELKDQLDFAGLKHSDTNIVIIGARPKGIPGH